MTRDVVVIPRRRRRRQTRPLLCFFLATTLPFVAPHHDGFRRCVAAFVVVPALSDSTRRWPQHRPRPSSPPPVSSAVGLTRAGDGGEPAAESAPTISRPRPPQETRRHDVGGVSCREVSLSIPAVGEVTVLEATLEAQGELVDMALLEDADEGAGSSLVEAGDPYGAVLWPSAREVASRLLSDGGPSLEGRTVLELGAGTGLVSIAAALAGAGVLATDHEPLALALTRYAAVELHGLASDRVDTRLFDVCDAAVPLPRADVVVAADIMYLPRTGRAMARRVLEALEQNSRVIVGDSPGRAGRPAFLQTLAELGLASATFEEVVGSTCVGPRHDLICGTGSSSVSTTPMEVSVGIMDLDPSILLENEKHLVN